MWRKGAKPAVSDAGVPRVGPLGDRSIPDGAKLFRMSDYAQGPGWGQAADGKWYPPHIAGLEERPLTGKRRPHLVPGLVALALGAAGFALVVVGGEAQLAIGSALLTGAVLAAVAVTWENRLENARAKEQEELEDRREREQRVIEERRLEDQRANEERRVRDQYQMTLGLMETLEGRTLAGLDLRGIQLPGRNLQQANFYRANLEGAHLWEANLEGANLRQANLEGAHLWGASLVGANLREANLVGANLFKANLEGAHLWEARYDTSTTWPRGFVRPSEAVLVSQPRLS